MILDNVNSLIPEAMKNQDKVRLTALRGIKTELTKAKTSGAVYTEDIEKNILVKLVKQYTEAIREFEVHDAKELSESYKAELEIIKEFAPKEVTEDDIIKKVDEVAAFLSMELKRDLSIKDMRTVVAKVKEIYPTADGGLISKTFKTILNH